MVAGERQTLPCSKLCSVPAGIRRYRVANGVTRGYRYHYIRMLLNRRGQIISNQKKRATTATLLNYVIPGDGLRVGGIGDHQEVIVMGGSTGPDPVAYDTEVTRIMHTSCVCLVDLIVPRHRVWTAFRAVGGLLLHSFSGGSCHDSEWFLTTAVAWQHKGF